MNYNVIVYISNFAKFYILRILSGNLTMITSFIRMVHSVEVSSKIVTFYPTDNSIAQRSMDVLLSPGTYQFEVWGAQGGMGMENNALKPEAYGGKGAYASTIIKLFDERKIYCYFGQKGSNAIKGGQSSKAFNGGGAGGYNTKHTAGGGGGATDCRLYPGDITNKTSRDSRFVVAGGGSGGGGNCPGAPGGGYYPFRMQEVSYGVYDKLEVQECLRDGIGDDGSSTTEGSGRYTHSATGAGAGFCGGVNSGNFDESYNAISRSGSSWGLGCEIPKNYVNLRYKVNKEDDVISAVGKCTVYNGGETFSTPGNLSLTEKGHEGNGAVRISQLLVNPNECTNGQIRVSRKRNHGVHFSLLGVESL